MARRNPRPKSRPQEEQSEPKEVFSEVQAVDLPDSSNDIIGLDGKVIGRILDPEPAEALVTWPARRSTSNAELIGEVASMLWKRAQLGDLQAVQPARILRTVGALVDRGDENALSALERKALEVNPNDLAGPSGTLPTPTGMMPPRESFDRGRNLGALVRLIESARTGAIASEGVPARVLAAIVVVKGIGHLFPQFAGRGGEPLKRVVTERPDGGWTVTIDGGRIRRPLSEAAARVLTAWEHVADHEGVEIDDLSSETLAVHALVAHGANRKKVNGWLQGIPGKSKVRWRARRDRT